MPAFPARRPYQHISADTAQGEWTMPRILVVDDEKSIRLTLSAFLKRDGLKALLANAPGE